MKCHSQTTSFSFSFLIFTFSPCAEPQQPGLHSHSLRAMPSPHPGCKTAPVCVSYVQETRHSLNVNCCSWVNVIPCRLLVPADVLQECPGAFKGQRSTCPGARGQARGSRWEANECVLRKEYVASVSLWVCVPSVSSWHLQSKAKFT